MTRWKRNGRPTAHADGSGFVDPLALRALGVDVAIRCAEPAARALLMAHYAHMRAPVDAVSLAYTVARRSGSWLLTKDGMDVVTAADPGELLLLLDHDLIIELQKRRHDLYFIHAAVLEFGGDAVLLVAASGGGKSTTTWALLHHGFGYLSDELGPVDLSTLIVHPYPRAVLLKNRPPRAYPLPRTTPSTSRGFHIRLDAVSGGMHATPARLSAIFFLRYAPEASEPSARAISVAQAAARLYANGLNTLAHPEDGIDAAIQVARNTTSFELTTAELTATCALVTSVMAHGV